MRFIELPKTKEKIPVLGQGTWGVKRFKNSSYYEQWKSSLKKGIELGMTHIDTAEFYGHGKAEKIISAVIREYGRDGLFITSKLFPNHLRYKSMKKAAYKSLKRLGIKNFDLYLIHWPSPFESIKKQMKVLEDLVEEGKTRYIGVSNFSVEQFKKAQNNLKKAMLVNNQLHINLNKQKHIHSSLPYYQTEGVIVTAYSPLGHRGFTNLDNTLNEHLESIAKKHNATIQQIAIAWLINHSNVITIPKAFQLKHVEANAKAADIVLSKDELSFLYDLNKN